MNISFKRETITEESIKILEQLRLNAYGVFESDISYSNTFYANELKNNKYLVYTAYINNELVGACYISNAHDSIYIEQLFIQIKYQNKNFGIGERLLSYALKDKSYIEQYFGKVYFNSYLSTSDKKLEQYYEQMGYKKIDDVYMKKSI